MRRGRIITFMSVLGMLAAMAVTTGAFAAASPRDICADLADNGKLDGAYTQAELEAAARDASIQGYCSFVVVPPTTTTTVTPQPECVEVPVGTPGAVQAPNGKYYTGTKSAAECGPASPPPAQQTAQVCVEATASTPGAVQGQDGKYYTGPNAHLCGTPPQKQQAPASAATTPPVPTVIGTVQQPVAPAEGGTLPGEKTIVAPQPKQQPAAQQQPQAAPQGQPLGQQSPLRATKRQTGTLPFTGAELFVFAIVGAALLLSGLLLRTTARQKARS